MAKRDYSRAILEFRTAAQSMPKDAEPYYELGVAYLEMGDLRSAALAFGQAIQKNPKHAGANLKLAELMTASQDKEFLERASTTLRNLLAASPNNPEAVDTLAMAETQLGKAEDAMQRLGDTLRRFPTRLTSSVVLARIKLAQKDMPGAEEVLKRAVAAAPQSAPAVLALAQMYLVVQQPEKAEAQLRKALELEPKNPSALWTLGRIQMEARRLDEANQTYQKLASLPEKAYRPIHAMFLQQADKKDAALLELEKLAKQYPDDLAVRSRLLSLYAEMHKTREAQDLLAAALKRDPKDVEALYQRGVLYLASGKLAEADHDLKQVLHFRPDSAEAHFAFAGVFRAEARPNLENEELNKALKLKPDLLGARLTLARNLIHANQPKSARELLDNAPAPQKNVAEVIIQRNWALLAAGDTEEVQKQLGLNLRTNRIPEFVLQEAVLKMAHHDYAGARSDAEEALKANLEDVRAARIIVQAYVAQNERRKAIDRLTEIVAYRPKSAPLQALLGDWYLTTGGLDDARRAFEAAKAADPAFRAADLGLAEIDRRQNRLDAARRRLAGVLAVDPKNIPALLQLATIEEAAADRAGAITRYRSVLALDNSNVFALNNLAYDLARENPDEALTFAQQAGELAPEDANVQDTLGWVYYRKGIYITAVNYLRTALAKDPTPQRQFHLAMSYLKAGQRELGQKMLVTALARDPNLTKTEQGW